MARRRPTGAIAAVVLALLCCAPAATASASSASAYRAQLNRICRGYTPRFKRIEADAVRAKKAGELDRVAYDLGLSLALALREDAQLEVVPVPAELRVQMAPTLRLLRQADGHARNAILYSQTGDLRAVAELRAIERLSKPLNTLLDAAGLRDCGSNQS